MQTVNPKITRTIRRIAGIVSIVVALTLPLGYFFVSYENQLGILDAQAEINARIASQVINTNPEMWRFMNVRLEEFLSRRPRAGHAEVRRIVDNDDKIIAQSADALGSPTIMRTAELLDSGVVVGRIEIVRSLRPVLIQTGGVAVLALLLSWMAYVALKIFPLRVLNRALAENTRLLGEAERRANEYAQLFEETGQRAQEQTALSTIASAASQSLEIHEMLQSALDKTLEATKRTVGIVRLKDDVTGRLRVVGHKGISETYANALDEEDRIGRKALAVLLTGEIRILSNPAPDEFMDDSRIEGLQSRLWVPIQARGKILGVLTVASKVIQPFETREIEILKAIGNIIGTAVANSRLFEETEQRAKEQEALNVIAKATSQSLHRDELLEIALNKVLEMMGHERVSIRLKDPVTGAIQLVAHRGFSQEEVEDLLRRVPHIASDQVFASGQPLVVNNRPEIQDPQPLLPRSYAVAWIPIKAGAKAIGVLGVATSRPVPFVQREIELLEAIGNVIGVALENAGLFEEAQRNLNRIQALREIDQAINSTLNLRQVLDVLLEKIEVFLPYASASTIRLLNKQSGQIEPITCRNLDEEEWKAEPWKVGRGSPNIVFESGRPVTVLDIQTDRRTKDAEFFRRHGLISYLGVPLVVQGEVKGVLSLYAKEKHAFSEQEIDFLLTLAGQASIAIHNSQLYEEVRRKVEELQQRSSELERANKAKGEFLSVMSHELRTPLNVVLGYAAMLKEGILGEINSKQQEALGKVLARANDQLQMINSILQATQIEAGAVRVTSEEVRLQEFFDEMRSAYELPINKEVTLDWQYPSELPVIKTDGGKLKHIVQNIVNNAIKFTEKGRVTISVQHRLEPNVIEFKVADTGVGIPRAMQPIIFEMFRQADSSENRPFEGVGLGLYIVKKLTRLLGGKVEVESEEGKGSTFIVTIPCDAVPEKIAGAPFNIPAQPDYPNREL